MSEALEHIKKEVLDALNDREVGAYKYFMASKKPSLAPALNARLFQLFLNGKGCEEIRRLNQSLGLGEIVAARIQGDWDRLRLDHQTRLLEETSLRVQQSTLETAEFVCDMLAVANREHGDKMRLYLQSGNPEDLGEFRIKSIQGLKFAIEALQKLTGQERTQTINVKGKVSHTTAPAAIDITSAKASQILKYLTAIDPDDTDKTDE
jgi:hypothetical protein